MDDSTRLCQKDTHTTSSLVSASSTIPIIGNDEENLNTSLIQDPIQVLELELMHAIPKDPVLETMFRHFESHIPDDKRVATCLKLNYIKLAAAHAMKEAENQDADLVLALQNLDVNNTECTIHTKDTPLKKAINAFRALAQKHKRVRKSSAFKLQQFIRDSGAQVPKVYQRMNLDDLSAVWYAINSDRHYICSESLDLCHPHEFQVFLITHLHLVGGTPSHRQMLKKPKYTTYQQFLALLPDLLNKARCNQPGRLGYSTKAPTTGPWLYQYAASLEALDVDRWEVLCEETYEVMRRDTDQVIFVIHADDQAIPSRIAAKVQSRPHPWNTWSAPVARITTSNEFLTLSPPDFLPGPLTGSATSLSHPIDAPSAITFSLASHPAPKRRASQTWDIEEQGNKKPKTEAQKEDR